MHRHVTDPRHRYLTPLRGRNQVPRFRPSPLVPVDLHSQNSWKATGHFSSLVSATTRPMSSCCAFNRNSTTTARQFRSERTTFHKTLKSDRNGGGRNSRNLSKSAKSVKFVQKTRFWEMSKVVEFRKIFKKSQNLGVQKVATPKNFTQNEGRPRNLAPKVTGFLGSKVKKSDFFLNSGVNQPLIRRVSGHFFDEIWHFLRNLALFRNFTLLALFGNFGKISGIPTFWHFSETGYF